MFAELIYEALFNGKLEWIGIADPGAGQVDDIQIACQGCLDALIARARNLMDTLSKPEKWNKQAEEKLRWWLKAADLELAFIRPRPSLAFQAYAHILAELADAEILDNYTTS
ncbi:MAG TPA: hypothetical protein VK469_19535 [Candidatus Kapabacteria bacterium]|nr:hypothetical protein [Candidatus Kapabacteria bacterium]